MSQPILHQPTMYHVVYLETGYLPGYQYVGKPIAVFNNIGLSTLLPRLTDLIKKSYGSWDGSIIENIAVNDESIYRKTFHIKFHKRWDGVRPQALTLHFAIVSVHLNDLPGEL